LVLRQQASKVPEIVKLLREKVKYVFVIFQENRAFDQMFGTFPDAHGLFSQPEKEMPGFTQYMVRRRTLGISMT
jgi:phospholipase C